jgi:hypothetical protein
VPGELFQIVVRKALGDIERELRAKYEIGKFPFDSAYIEGDSVVFVFSEPFLSQAGPSRKERKRPRRRSRRNRTKTRGWKPVASFTNSLGQRVRVYDSLLNALRDNTGASKGIQRQLVGNLLRSNGNSPTKDQVEYFLENTLEFLKSGQSAKGSSNVSLTEKK